MPIATVNPATGELVRTFEPLSPAEIEERVARAATTFRTFRKTTFGDRRHWMTAVADQLDSRKEEYGRLLTLEMGKPLKAAIAEVAKCATACRYYAENAENFLRDEPISTSASRSYVHHQPIGPVLAVMPWNFPFWQVFRFAAPALMAGNVGLLKHASNVPQCSLAIETIFAEGGFPPGAFQALLIGSDAVGPLLADRRIKAATLTGSEAAGRSMAASAGKALKKMVLELGGSDPFIVMESADLDEAVKVGVKARIVNNGQSCIAAKRFIVAEAIADEFTQKFVKAMESLTVGDPIDEATDIGPLATEQIVRDLEDQVRRSIESGARVLTGGKRLGSRGNFYAPTILVDIPNSAAAYSEELFGPVASLFRVRNIDEAIALANDTDFGLGASAWTNDADERARFIEEVDSGQVFINAMVASDPKLPFGGVKHSGYGRELGIYGIHEFVNIKTIWIDEPRAK